MNMFIFYKRLIARFTGFQGQIWRTSLHASVALVIRCVCRLGSLGERQFEPLLGDILPPLRAAVLFDKSKTRLFVKMPRRVQALKGPEVNPRISAAATEVHGSMQESCAYSPSTEFVRHDEPAEMR
ncbi:MAG: hypothetical protein PHN97_09465, partial [Smithellaceae bacterium]|nr:hypothetical protein [Smithellaceae bacterium]